MLVELKQVSGLVSALSARALTTTSIIAGTGLTGGGTLEAARTLSLTGNALALHNLSSNGIVARTGSGTVSVRTITGTSGRITISNGDGVSGNPTIDLASGVVSASTYKSVTVDTYGRVTAGSNPTTLSGYGITDALALAGGTLTGGIIFAPAMNTSNPALNSTPVGSRIVLRNTAGASAADFAIGYNTNKLWLGVQANSDTYTFDFYGGATSVATLTGTGTLTLAGSLNAVVKSFVIKHPTKKNWILQYSSLEGPENAVYIRGRLTGEGTIKLPSYWRKLVNYDTITVQLTPCNNLMYRCDGKVVNNSISVKTTGESVAVVNYDVFYMIMAERIDVAPLIVERKNINKG